MAQTLLKYLLFVVFCKSAFSLGSCARTISSLANSNDARLHLLTEGLKLKRLRLEDDRPSWENTVVEWPSRIQKFRAISTSKASFQASGFVAGLSLKDPNQVAIASILFPRVTQLDFTETVIDMAWSLSEKKRPVLHVLTRSKVVNIYFKYFEGKFTEQRRELNAVPIGIWDRVFVTSDHQILLVSETGEIIFVGQQQPKKISPWIQHIDDVVLVEDFEKITFELPLEVTQSFPEYNPHFPQAIETIISPPRP